jgi:hypothetical protein
MSSDKNLYDVMIRKLMETQDGRYVENGLAIHAAFLHNLFFEEAKESVRILCKKISAEVFGKHDFLIESARKAISAGKKSVRILITDDVEDSDFAQMLRAFCVPGCTNLSVKKIAPDKKGKATFNFSLMDKTAFRYEPNPEETRAVASMYDPKKAKDFAEIFQFFEVGATGVVWPEPKPTPPSSEMGLPQA